MSSKDLPGYRGATRSILENAGVAVGDEIEIVSQGRKYAGILIARYELADPDHIVIKLANGYNVGVRATNDAKVRKIAPGETPKFLPPPAPPGKAYLRKVSIFSTGGTIASRVDYRTGGVRPTFTSDDLLSIIPELAELALIETEALYNITSEDMTIEHWEAMARRIDRAYREGNAGVIIAHGTDTMGFSSAALSFSIQNPPFPIIFVGSQRSTDRPSNDAATNLIAAVRVAATSPISEVMIAMHHWHSDDVIALHRGTRVRKFHTSSRHAFRSVNDTPLALVQEGRLRILRTDYRARGHGDYRLRPKFNKDAALIKFYPGLNPVFFQRMQESGIRGFVLEGTGLGHVSSACIPVIKQLTDQGIFFGMTSQCIHGRVNMHVYGPARDLVKAGIVPLGDMLPETALVKLMWTLAQHVELEDVRKTMLTNLAGEISERTLPAEFYAVT